jgi:hypothetical protein
VVSLNGRLDSYSEVKAQFEALQPHADVMLFPHIADSRHEGHIGKLFAEVEQLRDFNCLSFTSVYHPPGEPLIGVGVCLSVSVPVHFDSLARKFAVFSSSTLWRVGGDTTSSISNSSGSTNRAPRLWKPHGKDNTDTMLVLAHYKEDMSWLSRQPFDYFPISKCCPEFGWAPNYLPINRGTEGAPYLKFITDHYDHLPPRMIFMHAHETSYHQSVSYVHCDTADCLRCSSALPVGRVSRI